MIPAGTPLGRVTAALAGSPTAGLVDADGRLLHLGKLEGWWDAPASSGQATQKVNDHGAFLSPAYYGPRIINWTTNVDGLSPADSMATARKFVDALPVDILTRFTVTDEAVSLTADVRQEGDPLVVRQGNRVVVSLSMIAPDSRRYGPTQSASTGLPVSTGGFTLPVTLPVTTGGSTVSGVVEAFNDGDLDSNPVFIVTGPVPAGATITDQGGRQLRIAEAVQAGRTLYIDTATRTALLDGVANRPVTGSWPVVRPGTNSYRFNASAYDAGAQLTISFRSARR